MLFRCHIRLDRWSEQLYKAELVVQRLDDNLQQLLYRRDNDQSPLSLVQGSCEFNSLDVGLAGERYC